LALLGGLLYRLDTEHLLPLSAGLLVLGARLACYYWRHVEEIDPEGRPNVGLMVPICNVVAYVLGPITLAEPPWMAIGVTVVAVLLLTARERLHGLARRVETGEIVRISFHQKTIGNHSLEAKLSLIVALSITSTISLTARSSRASFIIGSDPELWSAARTPTPLQTRGF
jgi:hypothetical protein